MNNSLIPCQNTLLIIISAILFILLMTGTTGSTAAISSKTVSIAHITAI